MNLTEYQHQARATAIYPEQSRFTYPLLGMIGECGEVAEKIKKIIRDEDNAITETKKDDIKMELGDLLWYCANICCETNENMATIYELKELGLFDSLEKMDLPELVMRINARIGCIVSFINREQLMHQSAMSGILSCIEQIGKMCGYTLSDICDANISKLQSRKNRNKIKGDGDNR